MRFAKPHWLLLVAYPYWLVLDVTLDTLVNDSAAPVQEVTIKDKTLFDKVRLID